MKKKKCLLFCILLGSALMTGMVITTFIITDLNDYHDLDRILGMELIISSLLLGIIVDLLFPRPDAKEGTYIVLELNSYGTPEIIREIQEDDLVFCCRKIFSMEYKILRTAPYLSKDEEYYAQVKYLDGKICSLRAPLNRIPTPGEAAKTILERSFSDRIRIFRNPHELADWISGQPKDLQAVFQEVMTDYLRRRFHSRQLL